MNSRTLSIVVLSVGILLASLLRLYTLNVSYWVDEVFMHEGVSGSFLSALTAHPTVIPDVLTHFFIQLDDSEVFLRLPSLIAGIVTVIALGLFCLKWGGVGLAIPVLVLVATSPVHVYHSQNARYYAFVMLFAALLLVCVTAFYKEREHDWSLAGIILFTAGGFLSHPFFLMLVLGIIGALAGNALIDLVRREKLHFNRQYAPVLGGMVAGATPFIVFWSPATLGALQRSASPSGAETTGTEAEGHRLTLTEYIGYVESIIGDLLPGGLLVVLAVSVAGFAWMFQRNRVLALCCAATFFTAPLTLVLVTVDHWYEARYFTYLLPAGILLCGAGIYNIVTAIRDVVGVLLERLSKRWPHIWKGETVAMGCGVALVTLVYAPHSVHELASHYAESRPGHDWRAVAQHLSKKMNEKDFVFYASEHEGYYTLSFYLERFLPERGTLLASSRSRRTQGLDKAALKETLDAVPYNTVWIVAQHDLLNKEMEGFIAQVADTNPVRGNVSLFVVGEPTENLLETPDFSELLWENRASYPEQDIVEVNYDQSKRNVLQIQSSDPPSYRVARIPISRPERSGSPRDEPVLSPGVTYTLSFHLEVTGVDPECPWDQAPEIVIEGLRHDGSSFRRRLLRIRHSYPWRRYMLQIRPGFDVPPDIRQAQVSIGFFGGIGTLRLDRVQLEEKPYATVYTRGHRPPHYDRFNLNVEP